MQSPGVRMSSDAVAAEGSPGFIRRHVVESALSARVRGGKSRRQSCPRPHRSWCRSLGRYADVMRDEAGVWRFARRRVIHEGFAAGSWLETELDERDADTRGRSAPTAMPFHRRQRVCAR
jgi:hypothetical protein